jgi:hypothetical protein
MAKTLICLLLLFLLAFCLLQRTQEGFQRATTSGLGSSTRALWAQMFLRLGKLEKGMKAKLDKINGNVEKTMEFMNVE